VRLATEGEAQGLEILDHKQQVLNHKQQVLNHKQLAL
jgi:hypothetical protein